MISFIKPLFPKNQKKTVFGWDDLGYRHHKTMIQAAGTQGMSDWPLAGVGQSLGTAWSLTK